MIFCFNLELSKKSPDVWECCRRWADCPHSLHFINALEAHHQCIQGMYFKQSNLHYIAGFKVNIYFTHLKTSDSWLKQGGWRMSNQLNFCLFGLLPEIVIGCVLIVWKIFDLYLSRKSHRTPQVLLSNTLLVMPYIQPSSWCSCTIVLQI